MRVAAEHEYEDALAWIGLAVDPLAPPPRVRERLLASATPLRSSRSHRALGRLFDLPRERVELLVERAHDDGEWLDGPVPGFRLLHAETGPAHRGAYAGLVRLAPRVRFPAHRHLGRETMIVLVGGIVLCDGRQVHAGQELVSEADSAHDFTVLDGAECVAAVLQIGGVAFVPPDP